jgi:hypothetical protein
LPVTPITCRRQQANRKLSYVMEHGQLGFLIYNRPARSVIVGAWLGSEVGSEVGVLKGTFDGIMQPTMGHSLLRMGLQFIQAMHSTGRPSLGGMLTLRQIC